MNPIIYLLVKALDVFLWLIIANIIVSWLLVFNVLNARNKWVYKFCKLLNKLTEPAMEKVRKFVPPLGGVDLTPMVIIFGIYILQGILHSMG